MSDKPDFIPSPADFFGWINRVMNISAQAAQEAIPKSPTNPADPLELWKMLIDRNEQVWSTFMRQITATPEFAQSLGRTASTTAAYRTQVQKAAKTYLEAADMPSRDDLTRVAKQIVALDAKVDDMNDTLVEGLDADSGLMERLVSSLEKLTARLERLETRLEGLNELSGRIGKLENQLTRLENSVKQAASTPAPVKNEAMTPTPVPEELEREVSEAAKPAPAPKLAAKRSRARKAETGK
jgi:polyhydroxyalkanoic acid synthase PhaR subunit